MKIQLSEHFTYKKLLRFVLPSIIMMIFTSIYSVVDGLFVSNFVGKTAVSYTHLSINSAIFFPLIYCPAYFLFLICTSGIATFS